MQIRSILVVSSTVAALTFSVSAQAGAQTPPASGAQKAAPAAKVPDAELKAAKLIADAPDAAGQVQAATAFMQKFPKSTLVHQIAINVAIKIGDVTDMAQQLALAQTFRATFPGTEETDLILPTIIDANVKLNKVDDAFKDAADFLSRHPDDLAATTQMAIVGVEQAKHGNNKYLADSEKHGLKAISVIEADQKPATIDEAQWTVYKTKWLGVLYQSLAVSSMMAGKTDDGEARLNKSVAANPSDPTTYYLLGNLTYGKFQTAYKAATTDETVKASYLVLDKAIDFYAHSVGLTEGDAAFKPMHDMVNDDLTKAYTFRHKKEDLKPEELQAQLQALIGKYKKASSAGF